MKPIYPDCKYNKLPTMTVAELVIELQKHNPDLLVATTWEGTCNAITPDRITLETTHEGVELVMIDAENH